MSATRPLPSRPSLEFEHKAAKALLRQLRAGNADALKRAASTDPALNNASATRIRLADAHRIIAREYGFTSWPRLVRWFGEVERQREGYRSDHQADFYHGSVRSWLDTSEARRLPQVRAIAAYVPRFYGMRPEEVGDVELTEAEARLVVARSNGFPSWEELVEQSAALIDRRFSRGEADPFRDAARAIGAADLAALQGIVELHPELLDPPGDEGKKGRSLILSALRHADKLGKDALKPIIEWLVTRGLDVQRTLNLQLGGHMGMKEEEVSWLLDHGANPNWVAPNGIPMLEHALVRYWNGAAVDVLVARATPRTSLWISAGLGDVDGVSRFLDRRGRPTAAARRNRPAFDVLMPTSIPSLPDADDEEILIEAVLVAMLNGRTEVTEYMLSRGTPVNSLIFGTPLVNLAVGNAWPDVVESFIRCGADLDLRGWMPNQSAREMAREMFEEDAENEVRRRIVEICGMDPEAILAERGARSAQPTTTRDDLYEALALADDDAARLAQDEVSCENLLFGLLRAGGPPLFFVTEASRLEVRRFYHDSSSRLQPAEGRVEGHARREPLPMDADAQAALEHARSIARERRREVVQGHHLLFALTSPAEGEVAAILRRYGANLAALNDALESNL